jgi:hypothetical protein
MKHEPAIIATLRRALDEVVRDGRFLRCKSASALEVAEHLLALAAAGEHDLQRLKGSALEMLSRKAEQSPRQAA